MKEIYADLSSEYDGVPIYTSVSEETRSKNMHSIFTQEKSEKLIKLVYDKQGHPVTVIDRIGQYIFAFVFMTDGSTFFQFIDASAIKNIDNFKLPKDYWWDEHTVNLVKKAYLLIQETPELKVRLNSRE